MPQESGILVPSPTHHLFHFTNCWGGGHGLVGVTTKVVSQDSVATATHMQDGPQSGLLRPAA